MYVKLDGRTVIEIIPDIDPTFPDVTVEERFPADFIAELMHAPYPKTAESFYTDTAQNVRLFYFALENSGIIMYNKIVYFNSNFFGGLICADL